MFLTALATVVKHEEQLLCSWTIDQIKSILGKTSASCRTVVECHVHSIQRSKPDTKELQTAWSSKTGRNKLWCWSQDSVAFGEEERGTKGLLGGWNCLSCSGGDYLVVYYANSFSCTDTCCVLFCMWIILYSKKIYQKENSWALEKSGPGWNPGSATRLW